MGELSVVARADLGGLGQTEGAPVLFAYTPVNVLPRLAPWALILVLLLAGGKRTGKAWWIWLPLGLLCVIPPLMLSALTILPSEIGQFFGPPFAALAFGLAALWLLAPLISWGRRWLVFLGMLGVLAAASGMAYACLADWAGNLAGESWVMLLPLGLAVLATTLGLSLAGWKCRRGWSGSRFTGYLFLGVVAAWFIILASFALIPVITGNDGPEPLEFALVWLGVTAWTFLTAWAFVILTCANGFYRQRLAGLFGAPLDPPAPPPG